MGKKMKKKAPNPRKAIQRVPAGSPLTTTADRKGDVVVEHEREGGTCNHYSKSVNVLNRILLRIRATSNDIVACESKKDSNFFWVCLDCNLRGRSEYCFTALWPCPTTLIPIKSTICGRFGAMTLLSRGAIRVILRFPLRCLQRRRRLPLSRQWIQRVELSQWHCMLTSEGYICC